MLRLTQLRALWTLLLLLCLAASSTAQANFGALRDRIVAEMKTGKGVSIRNINSLSKIKKPQARRLLLEIFDKARSDRERASAIGALAKREHKSLFAFFVRVLDETRNGSIARSAASGLARQEAPGIKRLAKFALHLRKPVRDASGRALVSAARKSDIARDALVQFIRDLPTNERAYPLSGLRGRTPTKAMLDVLADVVRARHEGARVEALRLFAELAPAQRTRALIATLEESLAGKKASNPVATAILYARLASLNDAHAEETLYATLEIETGLARELARLNKCEAAKDRAVKTLASVVRKHEGPSERLIAVEILAALRNKASDKALVDALSDESTAVALLAIDSVAMRKTQAAISALERLFRGEHEELQLEAMLALHGFADYRSRRSWAPRLRETLADGKRLGLRCAAVDCLRELRDAKALPLVQDCARAQEWQLRSAAFRFLEAMPDKASVGILVERLQSETGRLQGECLSALMLLTNKDYPKPRYWKQWWDTEGESWKLPQRPKIAKGKSRKGGKNRKGKNTGKEPKARRRALTYYNIPIVSNAASFLVDVSGSMAQRAGTAREPKIQAAKKALEMVLKNCTSERRFNVVPFASRTRAWQEGLRPMDDKHRTQAVAFTRTLRAAGGTNIYAALRHAFDDTKVDTIYLLSDGNPSTGEIVDPQALARAVAHWNRERRIVIHTIAFGYHSALLKRIAKDSGGTYVKYL